MTINLIGKDNRRLSLRGYVVTAVCWLLGYKPRVVVYTDDAFFHVSGPCQLVRKDPEDFTADFQRSVNRGGVGLVSSTAKEGTDNG